VILAVADVDRSLAFYRDLIVDPDAYLVEIEQPA
jgi:hypothetical protein